jgi:hypothetical protein
MIDEHPEYSIVREPHGPSSRLFYFDDEPHCRSVNKPLTKGEARRDCRPRR